MKLIKDILILMVGPQGSGKGTQAALLADKLKINHYVAGDSFRALKDQDSRLGKRVSEILERGELMPMDIWQEVVGQELRALDANSIILDGVLRSTEQIEAFEEIQKLKNWPELIVINLRLPRKVSISRLIKRKRHDDTPAQINARLNWSQSQIEAVLEHFRNKGKLIDIDANRPIEDIETEIDQRLAELKVVKYE